MNTVLDMLETERGTGVLKSTLPVVEQARHVWIDERGVARLAQRWTEEKVEIPAWNEEVHWSDGTLRTASAILLLDAWNFCFWPDPGRNGGSITTKNLTTDIWGWRRPSSGPSRRAIRCTLPSA
jgi:hypothetical protein